MCGRYMLTHPVEALQALFGFIDQPPLAPRYNIAPTQDVAVVRLGGDGVRRLAMLRWGLVPPRSQEIGPTAAPIINARAETVAEKPSFRDAFKRRRCLIPADGFFEWTRPGPEPDGRPGRKQPYRIGLADWQPIAFAGIWEHRTAKDGSGAAPPSCVLLTTGANPLVARVHRRMPVILAPADYGRWLDADADAGNLIALLRAYPAEAMDLYPVHRKVGSPQNDNPSVIKKLSLVLTASPDPALLRPVVADVAPPRQTPPRQTPPRRAPARQSKGAAAPPPAETVSPLVADPAGDRRPTVAEAPSTEAKDTNASRKEAGPNRPDRPRAVRTARRKPVQQNLF